MVEAGCAYLDRNSNKKQEKLFDKAIVHFTLKKPFETAFICNLKQKAKLDQLLQLNSHIQDAAFHV